MKHAIEFTKMHGAGNDYIYVDTRRFPLENPSELAQTWSQPHTGIGSDGLVLIGAPDNAAEADASMRIFNADGSEAMMCGNASRCIAKYLYDRKISRRNPIRLQTLSGIKLLQVHLNAQNEVESVTVDMGEPAFQVPQQYVEPSGGQIELPCTLVRGTFVSMGNPHYVVIDEDNSRVNPAHLGPMIEHHEAFPERTNVEFAYLLSPDTLRMRVWERGSGITMACGTGACATAVAAAKKGICSRRSTIVMDGGSLEIEWRASDNHVYMTGPATEVFTGIIQIELKNEN